MRQDEIINRVLVDCPPGMIGEYLVFLTQVIVHFLLGKGRIVMGDFLHQEIPMDQSGQGC